MSDKFGGASDARTFSGVFPVLATPFRQDGSPDEAGLVAITRYAIGAGVDGVVYPGVASEYETLTRPERIIDDLDTEVLQFRS